VRDKATGRPVAGVKVSASPSNVRGLYTTSFTDNVGRYEILVSPWPAGWIVLAQAAFLTATDKGWDDLNPLIKDPSRLPAGRGAVYRESPRFPGPPVPRAALMRLRPAHNFGGGQRRQVGAVADAEVSSTAEWRTAASKTPPGEPGSVPSTSQAGG
jgi:hypothetical protein